MEGPPGASVARKRDMRESIPGAIWARQSLRSGVPWRVGRRAATEPDDTAVRLLRGLREPRQTAGGFPCAGGSLAKLPASLPPNRLFGVLRKLRTARAASGAWRARAGPLPPAPSPASGRGGARHDGGGDRQRGDSPLPERGRVAALRPPGGGRTSALPHFRSSRRRQSGERAQVLHDGTARRGGGVAAFEDGDQAPAADAVRPLAEEQGEVVHLAGGDGEAAERVAGQDVEAGAQEDPLRRPGGGLVRARRRGRRRIPRRPRRRGPGRSGAAGRRGPRRRGRGRGAGARRRRGRRDRRQAPAPVPRGARAPQSTTSTRAAPRRSRRCRAATATLLNSECPPAWSAAASRPGGRAEQKALRASPASTVSTPVTAAPAEATAASQEASDTTAPAWKATGRPSAAARATASRTARRYSGVCTSSRSSSDAGRASTCTRWSCSAGMSRYTARTSAGMRPWWSGWLHPVSCRGLSWWLTNAVLTRAPVGGRSGIYCGARTRANDGARSGADSGRSRVRDSGPKGRDPAAVCRGSTPLGCVVCSPTEPKPDPGAAGGTPKPAVQSCWP